MEELGTWRSQKLFLKGNSWYWESPLASSQWIVLKELAWNLWWFSRISEQLPDLSMPHNMRVSRAYWDASVTVFSMHVSGCHHLWGIMEPLSFQLSFQWLPSSSHWQTLTWKHTGMGVLGNVVQSMEESNVVPN